MALKVTKTSSRKKVDPMPNGLKQAIICQIIDLGTRQRTDQKGEPRFFDDGNPMMANEVIVTFEFPTETIEVDGEDKPRWVSKRYVLSSSERSNLYKLSQAVFNRFEPDLTKYGGKHVTVNVGLTSGGNNKIDDVLPPMDTTATLSKDFVSFDLSAPDMTVWNSFPDWIKEEIKQSEDCPAKLKESTNTDEENPFE